MPTQRRVEAPRDTAAADPDEGRVQRAIGALPGEQREALVMAYFGGFTHVQIAETLHLSVDTVKRRIRLGLERLAADLLSERGGGGGL